MAGNWACNTHWKEACVATRIKSAITAQLIQIKDQTHIWARQYDRDVSNLLALQAEIAQEIAAQIQLTLSDHRRLDATRQSSLGPQAYEAYDLYLKGRYFWNKRTAQSFQQAIEYFQQAIAKDANFSRAYSGLADSYALMGGYSTTPQTESMPKARAAALKALQLDPGLAEAHTSLALITENFDYDWETAEKEYRRAIDLNPNYATAHHWYAEFLSLQGRFPEAFAESERARELDPLSLIIAADHGVTLFYARQYDASIAQFRAVKEMEPAFPRSHMVIAPYVEKKQFADALAELKEWSATLRRKRLDLGVAGFCIWPLGPERPSTASARQSTTVLRSRSRSSQSRSDALGFDRCG